MAAKRARNDDFVAWIERTIHLPIGLSADPGRIKLPIYLREIAAADDRSAHRENHVSEIAAIGFSTPFEPGWVSHDGIARVRAICAGTSSFLIVDEDNGRETGLRMRQGPHRVNLAA